MRVDHFSNVSPNDVLIHALTSFAWHTHTVRKCTRNTHIAIEVNVNLKHMNAYEIKLSIEEIFRLIFGILLSIMTVHCWQPAWLRLWYEHKCHFVIFSSLTGRDSWRPKKHQNKPKSYYKCKIWSSVLLYLMIIEHLWSRPMRFSSI